MVQQLDFFGRAPMKITPEPGRTEPRFWVRKLVIWKDRDTVVREISLRPGLNIIWSPDPADHPPEAAAADALGHGSGKTLFCRLLRYCLGEERFADEDQRHRIAHAFNKGMVGAEVIVDGTLWAVIRPISLGRRHFAVPNVDLAEWIASDQTATGIDPFRDAVEEQILTPAVTDLIDSDQESRAWLVALAWLTRDQECRFDHVLDWRSSASDSDSPTRDLASAERLAAVRALIGAIVRDELVLVGGVERLKVQRESQKRETDRHVWEAKRFRARLLSEMNLSEHEVPTGLLAIEPLRRTARILLARVAGVTSTVDLSDVPAMRSDWDDARSRAATLAADLRVSKANIAATEHLIHRIEAELPGMSAEVLAAETPLCPVCEVPINQALSEGCKISLVAPDLQAVRRRHENGKRDREEQLQRLAVHREEEQRLEKELRAAERDVEEKRTLLEAAEDAQKSHEQAWFEARRRIDEVDKLRDFLAELEQQERRAERLDTEIGQKNESLAAFREQQSAVFQNLSRFFEGIIDSLVPTATGSVTLDGKGIKLGVKLGGDRSTVAIDSLKVIAFDLAVLCMSIEGRIRLPAFLIHDSPREADLGLSVYHRLFETVQALEGAAEQPLFQYIVTTTTPPPDRFLREPWLVETLRGTPAIERLLRQDL